MDFLHREEEVDGGKWLSSTLPRDPAGKAVCELCSEVKRGPKDSSISGRGSGEERGEKGNIKA